MPSALIDTVKKTFEEEGWAFEAVEDRQVLLAAFEARTLNVKIHVQVFDEIGAVSVVSEAERSTYSAALRERLAELILRTNQTLTVGNFEMLWDEGRIVFRATNLFPDGKGDSGIIAGMVQTTISEMDRLMPMVDILFDAEKCTGGELAALSIPLLMESTEGAAGNYPDTSIEGNE